MKAQHLPTSQAWRIAPPRARSQAGASRALRSIIGGFQLQVLQKRTNAKKAFPTARPVHTVQCMYVPPWPVPWATWHSAELNHATRVASHRARAQSTQSSPPAADGDWSTRPAIAFFDISSCCGPCHATPDGWAHRGACGACAKLLFSTIASAGREEIAKKEPLVGGSVSRQGQILDFE